MNVKVVLVSDIDEINRKRDFLHIYIYYNYHRKITFADMYVLHINHIRTLI